MDRIYRARLSGVVALLLLSAVSTGHAQVLEELARKMGGYAYTPYYCGVRKIDPRFNPMSGCKLAEYPGNNWYRDAGSATYKFYFPGDRTVRIVQSANYPNLVYLVGTLKGSTINDIVWECPRDPMMRTPDRSPAWVKIASDGTSLTYSCDRPRSDSFLNPDAVYNYHLYRR